MRTAQEIATELGGARKDGNGWKCRCPVHDDHHGSLHISQAEDGGFLAHCFAGCDDRLVWQTVRDRLGLNGERLSTGKRSYQQAKGGESRAYLPPREPDPVDLRLSGAMPVADWRYRSASGTLLFVVARYEGADGRKTIRPWTWDGARWVAKALAAPRPLYGLQALAKRLDAPVLVVEGEKTAEAAARLFPGHVCMTWAGGADGVKHTDWTPLRGRDVLLLPDADEPGRRAMGDAAALLKPIARRVRSIDPPEGVDSGWDVADADWTVDQAGAWLKGQFSELAPMDWRALSEREPPAREWLIDGWLGKGHPTLMVGPGGAGKSLIAQQIGSCLSIGSSIIDTVPRPLRVLMWLCEDDEAELWRRQVAISHWLQRPLSDFSNLIVMARLGRDNTLMSTEFGRPIWTPLLDELREQCVDYRADVFIGDNLGQMFGANENARHDVTMFVNGVFAACGSATPLFLAHPSRGPGSEFAGSGAWENAVRMRWWFSYSLPDDQKSDEEFTDDDAVRYLCKRKTNYSVKDYRRFEWGTGVFVPSEGGQDDPLRDTHAARVIIHGIETLGERGIYGTESPSRGYLPSLIESYGLADGVPRAAIAKAMRRMIIDGKIRRAEVGKTANRMPKFGLIVC